MYKFFCAIPRVEIFSRFGFRFDESLHFIFLEKIISTINGFVANTNLWHIGHNGLCATFSEGVFCIYEIGVDVFGSYHILAVEYQFVGVVEVGKCHNHAMNMRHHTGFAVPAESAVCEVDFHAVGHQRFPKVSHLFALGNGVGAHQCGLNVGATHHIGGFLVPAAHIIQIPHILPVFAKRMNHIAFLLWALQTCADERWVAHDIGELGAGAYLLPVGAQGVALVYVAVVFQR